MSDLTFEAKARGRKDFLRGKSFHENTLHVQANRIAWEEGWREAESEARNPNLSQEVVPDHVSAGQGPRRV
jgi:ribosome modulation factor